MSLRGRRLALALVLALCPEMDGRAQEIPAGSSAAILAQAIVASRAEAVSEGVLAVPPPVRAALRGWIGETILGRARYRVGGGSGRSIQARVIGTRRVRAVTLVDVIVFRNAAETRDAALWLHELKHVEQYAAWGADGFARRYVEDARAVESEAYALQAAYERNPGPRGVSERGARARRATAE